MVLWKSVAVDAAIIAAVGPTVLTTDGKTVDATVGLSQLTAVITASV